MVSVSVFIRCRLLPWVSRSYASRRRLHGAARGSRTHSLLLTKQLHNHCAIAAVWHRPWFHYFKKIILSRSMPDGTLAHLRLAEREGFDPPYPFGLRFSRPTHLPILPPLQMVAREGVAPPSLGYGPCMLLLHHRAIEIGRN